MTSRPPFPAKFRILVTGGSGQLATALRWRGGAAVRVVGRPEFDFDRPDTLVRIMHDIRPDLVINAAAWTAVDAAEDQPDLARQANVEGPALLAWLCAGQAVPVLHVSTDYVFSGLKGQPYTEADPVSPRSVYGRTKAEGEKAVLGACAQAMILRTAWVYGPTGRNFIRTMLTAARRHSRLRVVADQSGNPTSAGDLADALLGIAARILHAGWQPHYRGVFHAAGSGSCTWHELACVALKHAGLTPPVMPITTADWPTHATRPMDARLDCSRLRQVFALELPHWRDSIGPVVAAMLRHDRQAVSG
ncbi:dTDP-4-dehydrorhamnose reductase [Komagataeibacter kakiaceti JCM 25156]|uniref:dTDP-4-dehydrorhamnose reductase n=1 Tax=Komagataeibacter kakiaceti TaxID=943261 RepID=UPI000683E0D4|nr:dTDP-4-dehydrorhamnose reductase [Komagataeibacter kakiaceti]